jgi:hypothetical protein
MAGAEAAAPDSELFYGDQHVIVEADTAAGRDYLRRLGADRPTPLAQPPVVDQGATLGNVQASSQLGHYQCGARTRAELIVCLNDAGQLTYTDTLAALAFASMPTDIYVASEAVRTYLTSLLAHLPGGANRSDLHIVTTPCTDQCAHQIRMERRS